MGALVESEGGWAALVDALFDRTRGIEDLPVDPGTIEKGIRRLAKKENEIGGQYGRWLLRYFAVPKSIETWTKWAGQYHSRFSDLPTGIRLEQLRLLERPPVSESRAVIWVHLGTASVAHQLLDFDQMNRRLAMASRVKNPSTEATIEKLLFEARIAKVGKAQILESAQKLLSDVADPIERAIYNARSLDQRAYLYLHPKDDLPNFGEALALYDSIDDVGVPFVSFRKYSGLAYIYWKTGKVEQAEAACVAAISEAGDGGFVRLRVMALNLMSHIKSENEEGVFKKRSERLARQLQDEELLVRILKKKN